MLLRIVAYLALVTLAFSPSASACHAPPTPQAHDACTDWQDPPFGAVAHAAVCAGAGISDAEALCSYAAETVDELIVGCPPSGIVFACST